MEGGDPYEDCISQKPRCALTSLSLALPTHIMDFKLRLHHAWFMVFMSCQRFYRCQIYNGGLWRKCFLDYCCTTIGHWECPRHIQLQSYIVLISQV